MDRRRLACMGGISKKHSKKRSGKSVAEELPHTVPKSGDRLPLVIRKNSDGDLIGMDGDWAYLLLSPVPENEVWECMVRSFYNGIMESREALPMKKICDFREWEEGVAKTVMSKEDDVLGLTGTDTSFKNVVEPSDTPDVPEDVSTEVSESVMETSIDGPVVSSEAVSVTEDVPSMDRTVPYKDYRDLDVKLQDAYREIGKLRKRLEDIPVLEEEIRSKERANRSLVTQVQSLEKKVKDNNVGNLESELEYYKSQCEFLSKELTQARDLVRLYSSGSRYSSVNTFLLGETTIHCNLLDDGRYRVYFSPRKRTVRFIPDDGGEILCSDRKVSVSAFRYYTAFDKVRELSAVKEGDETVIAFGDPGY